VHDDVLGRRVVQEARGGLPIERLLLPVDQRAHALDAGGVHHPGLRDAAPAAVERGMQPRAPGPVRRVLGAHRVAITPGGRQGRGDGLDARDLRRDAAPLLARERIDHVAEVGPRQPREHEIGEILGEAAGDDLRQRHAQRPQQVRAPRRADHGRAIPRIGDAHDGLPAVREPAIVDIVVVAGGEARDLQGFAAERVPEDGTRERFVGNPRQVHGIRQESAASSRGVAERLGDLDANANCPVAPL
jgi:hypothetical protein